VGDGARLTLLDANALLSLMLGEPADEQVSSLLEGGDCAIPAICLSEVIDGLIRKRGIDSAAVSERLGALIDEVLPVVPADHRIAWRAGELHATHYHRVHAALSFADCLLLATAEPEDQIATADAAVIATARKLDIKTIPLPDSRGNLPPA
jgi:predicted nucleic acid-binding protein